jgi:hypothetical protein
MPLANALKDRAHGYAARMGYRLLGFVVWQGGKRYLRKRYGRLIPSRRVLTGALVVSVVGGLAVAAAHRGNDS